jgi:CheY-like chemotaxis protein
MFRPLHRNEDVALVFEPADGLPPLYTDEAKLAQIIRNLVANALKFTARGEVRISARYDEARAAVVFGVADTGIGISPEDRFLIFDEFVQIESALQSEVRGTGLGLAVCQRLATLLGARLDVTSELGAGSTFTVEVPLVYVRMAAADEPSPPEAVDETGEDAPARSALIVDDDELARYLASRTLQSLGFAVVEANDGVAGLAAARERRPSLIVLDLKMPELDGFMVLQELKMDFRTADIPVVVQTARQLSTRERNLLSGAVAILDKREATRGSLATVVEALVGSA